MVVYRWEWAKLAVLFGVAGTAYAKCNVDGCALGGGMLSFETAAVAVVLLLDDDDDVMT